MVIIKTCRKSWESMNLIKKFFKYIIKNHVFIFILLIISFLASLLAFLYCATISLKYCYTGLIFFIPFVIILTSTALTAKISSTNWHKFIKKLTSVIVFCFNAFIIFIAQICITFFFLAFAALCNDVDLLNKIENYEKNFSHFPQEMIVHFPKHIPGNAKNVQICSEPYSFQGSQTFVLKFDIDKEYIKNELKKYKFKYKESSEHYAFWAITDNHRIKIDDFTFYVIDGTFDRHAENHGIAVNKDFSQIIYYYSNPD